MGLHWVCCRCRKNPNLKTRKRSDKARQQAFWISQFPENFIEIVKRNWKVDFKGSPFLEVYVKMKRALAEWIKKELESKK